MKIFVFFFLFFIGFSLVNAQYADMKIYKSFIRGGTTARVWREFHEFTYSDSTQVNIDGLDLDISHVFNNAKCSKLFQQKHGGFHVLVKSIKMDRNITFLCVCLVEYTI